MDLRHLDAEERLALIGLLKLTVLADSDISPEESLQMKRIAVAMGASTFRASIAEAHRRCSTRAQVEAQARAVTRPEARELIFSAVQEMAVSDDVAAEELQLMNWLADLWDL